MAYTSGSTILDDDYNIFAWGNPDGTINNTNNNVNTVAGVGSGDRGYGQTTVPAVAQGSVITAAQWATLLNKISTLANHQGTSITPITNPSVGDTIAVYSALQSNISAIVTNRRNAAANGTAITTGGTATRTTAWNVSVTATHTITFPSELQARYWFNAGGRIAIQTSRTGGSAEAKNTGWSNLCSAIGTINLTGWGSPAVIAGTTYDGTTKVGGSGVVNTIDTTNGVMQYGTTQAVRFRQYDDTVDYTANYIEITAARSANVVTVLVKFIDNADANTDELVDGTLTSSVTLYPPSTTYLSNSWGTPTMSSSQTGS